MKNLLILLSVILTLSSVNGQMVLSGDATGSCDCYTLTNTTNSSGSIWSPSTIDLSNSFDFTFEVNLGSNDGGGADGIVFALRQEGTSTGAGEGSLLGFNGINPSVGVEIDTWNSAPEVVVGDIPDDHVGMSMNGSVNHDLVGAIAIDNIEDGEFHLFNAVWNPVTFEFTVSIDGTTLFTHTGDLVSDVFGGDPEVYFGWTGATGGSFNVQQVCLVRNSDFTWEPEVPCPGQEVTFTSTATSGLIYNEIGLTSWSWEFEGGDTSDEENPLFTFDSEGTKDVTLTVSDISGCETEIELDINIQNLEPEIDIFTNVSCPGDEDGSATVSISPEDDYDFLWDDPLTQTSETATDLAPGTYTVIVTNDEGCSGEASVVIGEPSPVIFNDIITESSSCDVADGTVSLTGSGGTPPYSFSFNDGPFGPSGIFEDVAGGTYNIAIEDDNGCSHEETITVESSGLALDFIFNQPTCHGFSDGSLTIITEGAGDGLTFEITDSDGEVLNEDNSNTANSLTTGWYYFYVEDESGCFESDSVFIDEPGELFVDLLINHPLCFGDETGNVKVVDVYNFTGDFNEISYIWTPNPAGVGGVLADSSYNMGAGEYTLTINDENGCSKGFDFTITEPDSMYFSEFGYFPAYCRLHEYQSGNGVVFGAATGGTPDYSYLWTHVETEATSTNSTWGGRNPGNYVLLITDANGCTLNQSVLVDSLNPIAEFSVLSDQLNDDLKGTAPVIVNFENLSENYANPNNPLADTTFFWNFNTPNDNWQISHNYFEIFDTTYESRGYSYDAEVCLVAMNKNGCVDTTCKVIHIFEPIGFTPINIFTPNNDGINDLFTFEYGAASISQFNCVIVNRWGIVVHEITQISEGWDGTDRNGSPCNSGTYFYSYTAETNDGTELKGQGNLSLMR